MSEQRAEVLSQVEAARRLGVHSNTIRNWIKRGWLKADSKNKPYLAAVQEIEAGWAADAEPTNPALLPMPGWSQEADYHEFAVPYLGQIANRRDGS